MQPCIDLACVGLAPEQMQPGIETASVSAIYELESILQRIDPGRLFAKLQPLEVELGSGDGSFLVDYAARQTDRNFIGVERLLGRIRKMEKKARRASLSNLRGIRIESSYFLEHLLPPGSAAALHIYFPDPWPKRRHERHRLINARFPGLAAASLAKAGRVYLRTDDAPYFKQMTEVFAASSDFKEVETPEPLKNLLTDFEREFRLRGVETLRAAYELKRQ